MSSSPNKLTRIDFLNTVLPQEGLYCVVSLQNGKAQQTFLSTLGDVDQWAERQPVQSKDAYFSLASYNAYSGSKLPPIPDECCHPFHFKAATNSG
jgi:hypothetical protein